MGLFSNNKEEDLSELVQNAEVDTDNSNKINYSNTNNNEKKGFIKKSSDYIENKLQKYKESKAKRSEEAEVRELERSLEREKQISLLKNKLDQQKSIVKQKTELQRLKSEEFKTSTFGGMLTGFGSVGKNIVKKGKGNNSPLRELSNTGYNRKVDYNSFGGGHPFSSNSNVVKTHNGNVGVRSNFNNDRSNNVVRNAVVNPLRELSGSDSNVSNPFRNAFDREIVGKNNKGNSSGLKFKF